MKKLISLFFMLAAVAVAHAGVVTIDGAVSGKYSFYKSANLYLINDSLVETSVIESSGFFAFSVDIPYKEAYYVALEGDNGVKRMIYMVLAPGDKIVLRLMSSYSDLIIQSVMGSKEMEIIDEHQEYLFLLNSDLNDIEQKYKKAAEADRPALQKQYLDRYKRYCEEMDAYYVAHKSYLASIYMAYVDFVSEFNNHKAAFQTLYTALSSQHAGTIIMKEVEQRLSNPIEEGKTAPDLEGTTPDGVTVKLSDLKGKYVLVDFWASWCRPCRAENPNVVEAYNKYHSKGFEVFSISLDADATAWKSAIEADGLVWKNHICTFKRWACPQARKYRVNSIPFSVLVGPDGKIIAVKLRGEELQTKLQQIFH